MIALKKSISFLMGFLALIVAVAIVTVGVTMAVWSGSTRETNVVTIGNVRIELIDIYDYDDVPIFSPSNENTIAKTVSVKNIGNTKCYVRVLVKKGWYDKNGNEVDIAKEFIDPQYDTTGMWIKGTPVPNYSEYDVYYYQDVLNPQTDASVPLFEEFFFRESYTDNNTTYSFDIGQDGGMTGTIKVLAQAVQSEYLGLDGSDFGLKKDNGKIVGWPNDLVFN